LLAAAPERAAACSCAWPGAPCEAYESTPVIFTGHVSEIRTVHEPMTRDGSPEEEIDVVRFGVEQAFKGVSEREVEVRTNTESSMCGYQFGVGGEYLVYARQDDQGRLVTSHCTRTRKLEEAEEDLAFFRSLSDPAARARVVGTALVQDHGPDAGQGNTPLRDLKVTLEGAGRTFEATTDAEGRFEFSGVSAGTYRLSAAVPKTLEALDTRPITVSGACTVETYFVASVAGAITGRVVDSLGRPVKSMRLDLFRQDGGRNNPLTLFTDEDGRFAFERLPAGRFIFGANVVQGAEVERPFPKTYYPSGSAESDAKPIELRDGERVDDLVLQLSERLRETTIEGVVVWPDGSPAAEAMVYLAEPGSIRQRETGVSTDAEGRFSIKVLVGEGYTVHVSAQVKDPERRGDQMHAPPVTVTATAKPKPLRLVISLPYGH
jgi:hypothetical protein